MSDADKKGNGVIRPLAARRGTVDFFADAPPPPPPPAPPPAPQRVFVEDEKREIAVRVERPPDKDVRALRGPERKLGKGDWHMVYEAFQQTGDIAEISEHTSLKPAYIEHLLYNGLQRLRLPPIYDLVEQNAVGEELNALIGQNRELVTPEAQNGLQKRVKRDVQVAHQLIEQCVQSGALLQGYVNATLQAVAERRCEFIIPPAIGPKFLESLAASMNKHAGALEKAIKTMRLTHGESTENVAHNVGIMLAECSNEELEKSLAAGTLPARLMVRAGADPLERKPRDGDRPDDGPPPIDAEFSEEEIPISEAGKLPLHDQVSTVLEEQ